MKRVYGATHPDGVLWLLPPRPTVERLWKDMIDRMTQDLLASTAFLRFSRAQVTGEHMVFRITYNKGAVNGRAEEF